MKPLITQHQKSLVPSLLAELVHVRPITLPLIFLGTVVREHFAVEVLNRQKMFCCYSSIFYGVVSATFCYSKVFYLHTG